MTTDAPPLPAVLYWSASLAAQSNKREGHDDRHGLIDATCPTVMQHWVDGDGWCLIASLPADARRLVCDTPSPTHPGATADARTLDERLAVAGALAHLAAAAGSATPETRQALAVVLPLVTELAVFPDEWGVRFVDEDGKVEDPGEGDEYPTREPAERVVGRYVDARLVKRSSFRGPWTQVETS